MATASLWAQQDTIPQSFDIDTVPSYFDADTIPSQDGYYHAIDLSDNKPIPFPKIDNRNIRFYKRIYKDIDLKDTTNYILAIPEYSMMEAIMSALQEGKLTPYEDDAFKNKLSAREGESKFADSVLVPIFDDEGNQIDSRMTLNEFNPNRITKFRLKEDIFLDKVRGTIETRVIGVAPMMDINSSAELAQSIGSTPAFWLYYPQLRYALAKVDVSDPDAGLFDVTLDDVIVLGKYSSTIIRESSPKGAQQALLPDEIVDQKAESDKIQAKIDALKSNTWKSPKGVNEENLISPSEERLQKAPKAKKASKVKKEKEEENKTEEAVQGEVEG